MPPVPKPPAQRQRRNKVTTAASLDAPPAVKEPLPTRYLSFECADCPLPPLRHTLDDLAEAEIHPHRFEPKEATWRPETLRWWDTIWESPMVSEWVQADVPGLLVLAALVDDFWRFGEVKTAAEIRMQQREYGLSSLARRSLQWEVKRVEGHAAPAPAPRPRTRGGKAVLRALA